MAAHCLNWFLGLGVEFIRRQVSVLEVSFHSVILLHTLGDYHCSVSGAMELGHLFVHDFQFFLQLEKAGCIRYYYWGWSAWFPWCSFLCWRGLCARGTVSMIDVRSGAKKFIVSTSPVLLIVPFSSKRGLPLQWCPYRLQTALCLRPGWLIQPEC